MWTPERYAPVRAFFPEGSRRHALLKFFYSCISLPVYCAYPALLVLLWQAKDPRLLRAVLVPAAACVLCTVLRKVLNRPRPFEQEGFEPIIDTHAKGESFPSRHAASAVVIALAAWYAAPGMGTALTVVALLICAVRVLAGVHHLRDVAAGAALALLVGGIGFWLI